MPAKADNSSAWLTLTQADALAESLGAGYLIVTPAAQMTPGGIRRVLEPELAKGFIQIDKVRMEVDDAGKETGRMLVFFAPGVDLTIAETITRRGAEPYGWTIVRPGTLASWFRRIFPPKIPAGGPPAETPPVPPPTASADLQRALRIGAGVSGALGVSLLLRAAWLTFHAPRKGRAAQRRGRG
jgi:hypothetical protein